MQLLIPSAPREGLRGVLPRGVRGGTVGLNRLWPQPEPNKNVRGHMQRMRHRRRDLCVAARGGERSLRVLGVVVAMDDVMRYARVVRLLGKNFLENRTGLLLIGV